MHLTSILLKVTGGAGRRAQGNMWIGKHRIAHGVYPHTLATMTKKIKVEEENLFYLRHPYLTVEQERGHGGDLHKNYKWYSRQMVTRAARKLKVSVRNEQVFVVLHKSNSWDI